MSDKIRTCPFCNYDEGWVQYQGKEYAVECKVCYAKGPVSTNYIEAIELWNGKLAEENTQYSPFNEEAMGGVSAPAATLNNTPGIGNAVPATQAATTGAQFTNNNVKGSGDRWDNKSKNNKSKKSKKKYKISTFEDFVKENII